MIALESRPVRAERVLAQANAESLILLNPDDGQYYTLDEIGARIWQLCDGSRALTDVVTTIHAEYDAPVSEIRSDVLELVSELARERLLAGVQS
jgi:coenzyme PQQ synthesis protein D (PqqD)